ncbi:MAG: hypothetical protein K9G33_02045 [Sneathiella sp.]|nr:hypothetical protein [Sneathiella sp.]
MSKDLSTLEEFRDRARSTNVNDVTLLATDYLNHFNEALMLAELVIDMPDMLDDFVAWSPNSYKNHFRESGIADRDLAIEAYDFSPPEYKLPFETTTEQLDVEICTLQERMSTVGSDGEEQQNAEFAVGRCHLIRQLIDRAGSIINGQNLTDCAHSTGEEQDNEEVTFDQEDIDAMFG